MSDDTVAVAPIPVGPWQVSDGPAPPRRSPARVLLAGSNPLLAGELADILANAGFAIAARARDGAEAVTMAAELRPDLVLLDVAAPGALGVTAAGPISEQDIPVILMMSPSEGRLVQEAVAAGAMAWLVKPIVPASLVATAEMVLARHAEIAALRRSALQVRNRIEEHKIAERAKGLLMARHSVSESVATDWMRQTSADTGSSLAQVAAAIVEQWSSGPGAPTSSSTRRRNDTTLVTASATRPPVDLEEHRRRRPNQRGRVSP